MNKRFEKSISNFMSDYANSAKISVDGCYLRYRRFDVKWDENDFVFGCEQVINNLKVPEIIIIKINKSATAFKYNLSLT
ncbi:MAG: hypothetical protein JW786_07710 [Desulfobacterales bacterium]|nr:hypothetical protein [Desulfobacterales bacterium]